MIYGNDSAFYFTPHRWFNEPLLRFLRAIVASEQMKDFLH